MFWRRRRSEDDISDEIRAHLELEADDLVAEGLPEQQARAAARREFGSVALTRQRLYEKGRVLWLDDLVRDLRHSVALYRRAPGFTIAVVVTLALGIGLNTAIFSFVNALLLRPLPVPNSERLVAIHTSDFSGPAHGSTGYPDYVDFRDNARDVLTGLAAYSMELMNLSDGAASDRVQGHVVTQNYFSVVGVDVARGRVFGPDDEDVVVVSHGLWQRMLGGREDVLGRRLTINGKPSVVIGVAPPGFTGLLRGLPADLWLPLERQSQHAERLTERGSRWLTVVGRLADGVELPRAQAAFKVIADQLHRAYPQEWSDLKGRREADHPRARQPVAVARRPRRRPAVHGHADGSRRHRAAAGLRQRLEPHAGACRRAKPRDGDSIVGRRRTSSGASSVVHGEPAARDPGRPDQHARRVRRDDAVWSECSRPCRCESRST